MQKSRLDRLLKQQLSINRNAIRLLLAQGKVIVDGIVIRDADWQVNKFSCIEVDGAPLPYDMPYYFMLNKPKGVVSATVDDKHKTVIDLLNVVEKQQLHIVGRLDLNTTGLVLLTNNSDWSERLTLPTQKVKKVYQVTLKNKLTSEYIEAFAAGMYFDYEDITTQPALLDIQSDYQAQVTLTEGRYHQIKRMFGRFRNEVVALHRSQVGGLILDKQLALGESRALTSIEIEQIFN